MEATSNTFDLVKSLTPPEKRFFKLFSKKNAATKKYSYIKLFDAFDKWNREYDEKAFLKYHRGKSFVKYFADEKKHLEEQVLHAMRQLQDSIGAHRKINNMLMDASFLKAKRLNELQRKALLQAKKLAQQSDLLPELLMIAEREADFVIETQHVHLNKKYKASAEEETAFLRHLNILVSLRQISNQLFITLRTSTELKREEQLHLVADAESAAVIMEYKPGLSFACDYHYYRILAISNKLRGNKIEHMRLLQKMYQLYLDYPLQKEQNAGGYKISLFNYMNACFSAGDLSQFPFLLNEAKALPANDEDEEGENWQNVIHLELIYLVNTFQLEKAQALSKAIIAGVRRYKAKVNKAREMALYYNLASAFFVDGKWSQSLDWYNRILNDTTSVRADLKLAAELLSLISFYELGDFLLVDYKIQNYSRKTRPNGNVPINFLKLIRCLLRQDNKVIKQLIAATKAECVSIPELMLWLNAKEHVTNIKQEFKAALYPL